MTAVFMLMEYLGGSGGGAYTVSATTPFSVLALQASGGTFVLTAAVTGGVGPFNYLWTASPQDIGIWTTGGTTMVYNATVSNVRIGGGTSDANYICTVTDTGAGGKQAVSNTLALTFINLSGGSPFL